MQRDTTKLTIGSHTFEVKTYATAREKNAMEQAVFSGSKVELVGQESKITELNTNVQYEIKLEMIRQMVVSMDDLAENIVPRCEDLPSETFDELLAAIDGIASKKKS